MTYKKIGRALCAFIVICTLFMGVSAFADTHTITAKLENIDLSGTVKIVGNIGQEIYGENVSLTVYTDGNDGEGLLGALNQAAYVSAFNDTYTEADGSFTFEFKINGEQKSGFYTAYIADTVSEVPAEVTFLYSNIGARKTAIEELNTKTTAQEVYDFVFGESGKWMDLGFYSELQEKLDRLNISEIIAERLNKTGDFDPNKGDEVTKEYLYLEVIDALNEEKLDDISEYADRFMLNDSGISAWFEKEYITSSVKSDITERLAGKGFKTAAEFEAAFTEAVVLETVENSDGPGTVRDILTEYADKIDADVASAKIADFRKLTGSYASYAELSDKLDEILSGNSSGGSGSGGGGGGGGSSSGGSSSGGMNGVGTSVIEKTEEDKKPEAMQVQNERFADLKDAEWAREAVLALADKGIINGRSESVFAPNEHITREEFVKIIAEAFNIAITNESAGFSDVKAGEWYAAYVDSAYKAGIVKGIGDGRFGTGQKISRQDMAVMAYNAAKNSGKALNAVKEKIEFADNYLIASYAKEAVSAMQMAGVISGIGDNLFSPNGYATRAEAAKMVYGIISLQ